MEVTLLFSLHTSHKFQRKFSLAFLTYHLRFPYFFDHIPLIHIMFHALLLCPLLITMLTTYKFLMVDSRMHVYSRGTLLIGYLNQLCSKCLRVHDVLIVLISEGTCFSYHICKLSSSSDSLIWSRTLSKITGRWVFMYLCDSWIRIIGTSFCCFATLPSLLQEGPHSGYHYLWCRDDYSW